MGGLKVAHKLIFFQVFKKMIAKLTKANREHKKYKVVLMASDGSKLKTV
jgi:hypothetical protein